MSTFEGTLVRLILTVAHMIQGGLQVDRAGNPFVTWGSLRNNHLQKLNLNLLRKLSYPKQVDFILRW